MMEEKREDDDQVFEWDKPREYMFSVRYGRITYEEWLYLERARLERETGHKYYILKNEFGSVAMFRRG